MNPRTLISIAAAFGLLVFGQGAGAADAIGYVRVLQGPASLVQDGKETQAGIDAPLVQGARISTGAGTSMGLVFKDNTVVALGPASEIVVDAYAYQPGQGQFKLDATINRGTLVYLAGAIARQNPAGVNLKTPTGTVGVRGTHFAVKVDGQ